MVGLVKAMYIIYLALATPYTVRVTNLPVLSSIILGRATAEICITIEYVTNDGLLYRIYPSVPPEWLEN